LAAESRVTIAVDRDDVIVASTDLRRDRVARLFFEGILGGSPNEDGWRCPRRRKPLETIVVRINSFLESKGWVVDRSAIADESVKREIERKRSFERTKETAISLREGRPALSFADVAARLAEFGWNGKTRSLREHQERGLLHALTAINTANFSVPGAGKTAVALAAAAVHLASETIDLVLIVGPLSCFRPWEKEVAAAIPGRIRPRRIRGTAAQRRMAYCSARRGELIMISYATAAADRFAIIELCRSFRTMLVVDESHRIKRFKGGCWAPALIDIARCARIRMILSGTPMPQSGKDLFSQLNVLWPGGDLTGPRDGFASRVERNFSAVVRDIRPFVSRAAKGELGLPPYEIKAHDVALGGTQAEVYELIESHFRKRLEDSATWHDKLETLRRARPIRLIQAASNPHVLNARDSQYHLPEFVPANGTLMERLAGYANLEAPAKSAAALQLVKEILEKGEKVVCWSNFIANLDHFSAMVRKESGGQVFQVDGRVPAGDETEFDHMTVARLNPQDRDNRERVIDRFLGHAGGAVLITNPASCSESISLHTSCHNAIYLDRTFDCALFLQSIDRIHRLGLAADAQIRIHLLIATCRGRATIDEVVHQALLRKEAVMKSLLEGVELSPFNLSGDALRAAEGDEEDLAAVLRFLLGEDP
jgi:SNF2 family DNA or RNA helicase